MIHSKKYFFGLFSVFLFFALPSCADAKRDVTMGTMLNNQKNNAQIKLYVYPSCPYCHKVVAYLKSVGQENKVQLVDVTKAENLQELKQLNNNNTQCPFLYDIEKDVKMLESADIIEYLKKRF